MRMRLTDADLKEIIYERNLPQNFKSDSGMEERSVILDHRLGNACFNEQWFEGIHINEGKIALNDTIQMKMESSEPIIEMHFSLSGTSHVSMQGVKEKFVFDARRHNIFYMPSFDGYLESGKQREINHAFEIHLTENYFKKLINQECSVLSQFAENIEKKTLSPLSKHNMFITAQMDTLVHDIMNCRKTGVLKRLYIESKVLELLLLQVEQFEATLLKKDCSCLKEYDIEKIHFAKYLVEQNISNPLSLTELSRKAGVNDFKLKKGFKELFGNTVFGYLHELRMEEAKRLLLDHNMPLAEVSEYCGYDHVQHFSRAFKKKHGVTPGKFRM